MKKRPGNIILHKSAKNYDMLHCSWNIAYVGCNCYFSFWTIFSPFTPSNSPKNENVTKMIKNNWRCQHLLQVYQKLWSYAILFLRYGVWQMQLRFIILGYFLLFYPLTVPKIQISKQWNKRLETSSFYSSAPKLKIICCAVPEKWCVTDVTIIFYFGLYFGLLLPVTA